MFARRQDVDASSVDILETSFTSTHADVGVVFQNRAEVTHTAGIKVSFSVFVVAYSCCPYREQLKLQLSKNHLCRASFIYSPQKMDSTCLHN